MKPVKNKAVFFDRDGVINKARIVNGLPYPPIGLTGLEIYDDVISSIKKLKASGFMTFIATNQPDVARGILDISAVSEIHDYLNKILDLDGIYLCIHDSEDNCVCRKPSPGMLIAAAKEHNLNLRDSFMIGDRWRDVQAAQNAGCTPIFIDRGYSEAAPTGEFIFADSVMDAASIILEGMKYEDGR